MPQPALLCAPLLLAIVLGIAGVGKLRSPRGDAASLAALGVPRAFATDAVARAHPWLELALALGLLLGTGAVGVVAACASLALVVAYLVLVTRVLQRGEVVDCDCFGAQGPSPVTRATVVRNAWYVVLAVVSVVAHASGAGPLRIVPELSAEQRWWLLAVLAAGITAALTVRGPGASEAAAEQADEAEPGDYLRSRTPAVPVTLHDGSTLTLRNLSESRPQLLLFVSMTCGLCHSVIRQAPEWRAALPMLDVRLVYTVPRPGDDLGEDDKRDEGDDLTVYDPQRWAYDSLGIEGNPSAVVLGVDGLLAGGPVAGPDEVTQLVADLRAELAVLVPDRDTTQ